MRRMRRLVAVIQRVGAEAIEGSDGSFEKGHKLFIGGRRRKRMGTAGCCKFIWVARNERISHHGHKSAKPIRRVSSYYY